MCVCGDVYVCVCTCACRGKTQRRKSTVKLQSTSKVDNGSTLLALTATINNEPARRSLHFHSCVRRLDTSLAPRPLFFHRRKSLTVWRTRGKELADVCVCVCVHTHGHQIDQIMSETAKNRATVERQAASESTAALPLPPPHFATSNV